MPRFDDIGLFWSDVHTRKRGERAPRQIADIPKTGWKCPTYFPNLSSAKVISFDVETYDPELAPHGPGWGRNKGHICGFSLAVDGGHRWYYPLTHEISKEENHPYPDYCLAWLKDILELPMPKIGANLIYDVGWCRHHGIKVAGDLIDVQFAEALLDDRAEVNLDAMAHKWLGIGKETDLLHKWIMDSYAPPTDKWRREIYRSPPSLVGPYGEVDSDLPLRMASRLYEALYRDGLLNLFRMECGLINLLVDMRFQGVQVNLEKAEELRGNLDKRVIESTAKLRADVGFDVNIDAAASLAKVFDKFGLKYPRTKPSKIHKKGQPSFRKEFLQSVDHPIAALILDIRRMSKLKNTFVEGYILNGHVDGKVHGSYHPLRGEGGGTIVGRYSSSQPNLTNLPIRDPELGKLIRSIFIPDPGHTGWLKNDYNQYQFRGLVHYAKGPGSDDARALYNRNPGTDYHSMVKTLTEQVTGREWERRLIKNLNFGKAFGMGDAKAGASTGLKGKELQQFLAAYEKAVPFAKSTMKWVMSLAAEQGWVPTVLGRRAKYDLWEKARNWEDEEEIDPKTGKPYPPLPFEDAVRKWGRVQRAYLHTALPRLLQGTEGDTIKTSLYKCYTEGVFKYTGIPRLLVHDEVDFSDTGQCPQEAWDYMRNVMETAVPLSVPILVGTEIGTDWGSCTEICRYCRVPLPKQLNFMCENCRKIKAAA